MTGELTEKGRNVLGYPCKTCGSTLTLHMRTKQVFLEVPANMKACSGCTANAAMRADDFNTCFQLDSAPAFTPEEDPDDSQVEMLNIEGVHTWFYNREEEQRAPGWRHIEDL